MSSRRQAGLLLPVLVALLTASALFNQRLLEQRFEAPPHAGLSTPRQPPPPGIALVTVFLGGFRGMIADVLWLRAADLQDRGRYLELVQLASWITALKPQFAEVWAMQAWNMAYNLSVLMPDDEHRWRWVQNGIALLRDQALQANPLDPTLCFELGWMFQHKIGGHTDDHADAYKRRWARLIIQQVSEDGHLADHAHDAPWRAPLETRFGMNPDLVRQVDIRYGPLDWRVAESHAVYWAHAGTLREPSSPAAVRCRRMRYQSMAALFKGGTLTAQPGAGIFVFGPYIELLPGVILAFEEALEAGDDTTAPAAFANFLQEATALLAFYGMQDDAKVLFERLHQQFPSTATRRGYTEFLRRTPAPKPPRILR